MVIYKEYLSRRLAWKDARRNHFFKTGLDKGTIVLFFWLHFWFFLL